MTYPDLVTSLTPRACCEHLYDLAARVPKTQAVVEIGVYRARTTVWLAAGAQSGRGAHVYGVDPWTLPGDKPRKAKFARSETERFAADYVTETGYGDAITLVRGYSADVAAAWSGPRVGLLYVDGDHTVDGVLGDWEAWRPHLVGTATVVWDDYLHPRIEGVREAVDRLHADGYLTQPTVVADRIAVTRLTRKR